MQPYGRKKIITMMGHNTTFYNIPPQEKQSIMHKYNDTDWAIHPHYNYNYLSTYLYHSIYLIKNNSNNSIIITSTDSHKYMPIIAEHPIGEFLFDDSTNIRS